ncbi:ribbon-helix-helix protein, CopG family [Rhizobium sp. PL01]|uniref:ribbon-helix-helix protein, CopG family n=1 Tax=Rhizobium sp. PL01 TaxID=3085631 RepID=UPI0029815DEF|nr:ribbon-helix-helix protein, CopG family [Rhizobium sp. PL01]MDW5315083.1 hypothetical protein [Rhizobium sp. PL01]
MKTSSIRIRIAEEDKARIELFAERMNLSISEILRQAAASAVRGEVPGAKERRAATAVRRSSNHVLSILDTKPVELEYLRSAVADLRISVRELVLCR